MESDDDALPCVEIQFSGTAGSGKTYLARLVALLLRGMGYEVHAQPNEHRIFVRTQNPAFAKPPKDASSVAPERAAYGKCIGLSIARAREVQRAASPIMLTGRARKAQKK